MYFSHSKTLRRSVIAAALVLVVLLAAAVWLQPGPDDALAEQMGAVHAITWDGDALRLEGPAPAGSTITASLDGAPLTATTNDAGVFVLTATREQRMPARLQLHVVDQDYDILITRWQRRFVVLQRKSGDLPWRPIVGYNAALVAGAAMAVKTDNAYGITFYLPPTAKAATVYIYADDQLVQTAPNPPPFLTTTLPADATSTRLDVYDAAGVLQQRARLLLPPSEATARYNLSDGTLWLFADLTAQKAEPDEMIPGQFIPVVEDHKP